MIIRIQTRDDSGKFKDATPYDFAQAAFGRIGDQGWQWLINQLGKYCIERAKGASCNPDGADQWYGRYQDLRGIK